MRVLVSASTFPLEPADGIPRFVQDLCESLAPRCAVTVLAPGAPGAPARERLGPDGCLDVRRFDYFWPRSAQRLAYGAGMPDNLRRSWLARLQAPGFLACQARALRALAREVRADVVNAHWIVPQGLAAALARGRERRFAHVVTLHGGDSYFLPRLPAARRIADFVVSRSDALVAVSGNVRDNLDRVLGRPSGAVVQPVGVHTARFRDAAGAEPVAAPFPDGFLLFVGRFIAIKGLDVLLRALPRVRERFPGLGLVAIGYGPQEAELRGLARELGLADAVVFAGRRDHAEVAATLRACRAAVVPSVVDADGRAEGMPSVVAEALAAGARLVATDAGGIPDVVAPGRVGWLARPGDPEDLARSVCDALASPVPPDAAAAADALDWTRVADRTLAIFERAAGGASADARGAAA